VLVLFQNKYMQYASFHLAVLLSQHSIMFANYNALCFVQKLGAKDTYRTVCAAQCVGTPHALHVTAVVTTAAGTFVVERVGRSTLLAVGGSMIAATMAMLAVLLAAVPTGPALLPVALVLLCVNRVALTCTLQPLAATGRCTVHVQHVFAGVCSSAQCQVHATHMCQLCGLF
jgi:hypothetical protein